MSPFVFKNLTQLYSDRKLLFQNRTVSSTPASWTPAAEGASFYWGIEFSDAVTVMSTAISSWPAMAGAVVTISCSQPTGANQPMYTTDGVLFIANDHMIVGDSLTFANICGSGPTTVYVFTKQNAASPESSCAYSGNGFATGKKLVVCAYDDAGTRENDLLMYHGDVGGYCFSTSNTHKMSTNTMLQYSYLWTGTAYARTLKSDQTVLSIAVVGNSAPATGVPANPMAVGQRGDGFNYLANSHIKGMYIFQTISASIDAQMYTYGQSKGYIT